MAEQQSVEDSGLSLADRMRRRGVDMGWYDRAVAKRGKKKLSEAVLTTTCTNLLSIYIFKPDGSLWTVNHGGDQYKQVRVEYTDSEWPETQIYICLGCGKRTATFKELSGHADD